MERLEESDGSKRDMKDSFPPLLRGVGTVVILMAAVIAFCIARQHDQSHRTNVSPNQSASGKESANALAPSVSVTHEPSAKIAQDNVVEEVLENDWVEWLGFAGTAIFAASFFVEAYVRQNKNT